MDLSAAMHGNELGRLQELNRKASELHFVGLEKVTERIERLSERREPRPDALLSRAERRPSTPDLQAALDPKNKRSFDYLRFK